MATYTSDKATSGIPAREIHAGVVAEVATYTTSAILSGGDVIQMVKVGAGARLVGLYTKFDEELVYEVGDGNNVDRYVASASASTTNTMRDLDYEYTASDTIDIRYVSGAALTANVVEMTALIAYDN